MVDQGIVNYLAEGKRRGFSESLLKQKLLEGGFKQRDIEEAAAYLKSGGRRANLNLPAKRGLYNFGKNNSASTVRGGTNEKKENKERPAGEERKKPKINYLKMSAWLGSILILFYLILIIMNLFVVNLMESILDNNFATLFILIVFSAIFCLYLYGLINLGKKTEEKLLKIGAWMSIGVYLGVFILTIVTASTISKKNIIFFESIYIFFGVLFLGAILLKGLGLLKAGEQIKLARAAGILKLILVVLGLILIVSGAIAMFTIGSDTGYRLMKGTTTYARAHLDDKLGINGIIFGADFLAFWVLMIISFVLETKVLFNAAKKFGN